MKNALAELVYTKQIQNERPDPKKYFRFVATLQQVKSSNDVVITPNIKMKLISQPQSQNIKEFKPKDQVLVFGQVLEQGQFFEGQIRKITIQQALKYDMIMKKLTTKSFLQQHKFITQNLNITENDNQNSPQIIGNRNSGFFTHF